jgi:hypothetical protein
MKKIFLYLLFFFACGKSHAQDLFYEANNLIAAYSPHANDWMMVLAAEGSNGMPLYDSIGNMTWDDPNGIYVLKNIAGTCTLQKILQQFEGNKLVYKKTKPINLSADKICSYTVDSIDQAAREYILPFIYHRDSSNRYHVQPKSYHQASFRICFKTANQTSFSEFDEEGLEKSIPSFEIKNLNYEYNTHTFLYRILTDLNKLTTKHFLSHLLIIPDAGTTGN